MKGLLFLLFTFFQTVVYSQGLFKGDRFELDKEMLFKKIPGIDVWDKTGKTYKLDNYILANQKYKDKPILLIFWGTGESTGFNSIAEIADKGLDDRFNIITIFLGSNTVDKPVFERMNIHLQEKEVNAKWNKFLVVAAAIFDTTVNKYIKGYPKYLFADKALNIVVFADVKGYMSTVNMLENIDAGLKKGDKLWYTEEGDFCKATDNTIAQYTQYKVENNNVHFTVGTPEKITASVGYLRQGDEYLFDGPHVSFYGDGQKRSQGKFKAGIPVETFYFWHSNGKIAFEYPVNGETKSYDDAGRLRAKGKVVNGLGNGIFTEYGEDDKITAEYNYKNGEQSGLQKQYQGAVDPIVRFVLPGYECDWYNIQGLQKVKKGNLWGFIDKTGKVIVPAKYTWVNDFNEERAAVGIGEAHGYIDKTGKVVIPLIYTHAWDFENGIARVSTKEEPQFKIDKNGVRVKEKNNGTDEVAISLNEIKKYDEVGSYYEGIAWVRIKDKYGFINEDRIEITAIEYDKVWDFNEGMAAVKKEDKMGFINTVGTLVIPVKYYAANSFINGHAKVMLLNNGKILTGFINKSGKEIIPVIYSFAFPDGKEYITVTLDGKKGKINWNGDVVIPIIYDEVSSLSEGRIKVKLNNKYGFIDINNNKITAVKYEDALDFSEGMAAVSTANLQGTLGNWGFINMDGKEVIKPKYIRANSFQGGRAKVAAGNNWIEINKKGEIQD